MISCIAAVLFHFAALLVVAYRFKNMQSTPKGEVDSSGKGGIKQKSLKQVFIVNEDDTLIASQA